MILSGCVEPKNEPLTQTDCESGFLPCEDDSTQCCEVVCAPGYYLGGKDSSECLEIVCPPGYYLGGLDSTECLEIVCPTGYYLGGEDSTECLEVICPPGYYLGGEDSLECIQVECTSYFHNCGENLTECCPDTLIYGQFPIGRQWVYNSGESYSGELFGGSWRKSGVETWEVVSISPDSVLIHIEANWSGTSMNEGVEDSLYTNTQATLNLQTGIFAISSYNGFSALSGLGTPHVSVMQTYEGSDLRVSKEWSSYDHIYQYNYYLNIDKGVTSLSYSHIDGFVATNYQWTMELVE